MTCLDEGTLQAYLDGELAPELLNGAAMHLAACPSCAEAACAAEAELALFSTAYAPLLQASVPTEILRARLDNAIAELNSPQRRVAAMPAPGRVRSFFASLVASLTTFSPRQATAFASLLVAVALAVVFFALTRTPDNPTSPKEIAGNSQTATPANPVVRTVEQPTQSDQVAIKTPDSTIIATNALANAKRPPVLRGRRYEVASNAGTRAGNPIVKDESALAPVVTSTSEPVLADEKTYINSIASLSSAIEAQGSGGLTPTLRAEYERNLAVVNQAIVSSRVAARRNPQDTDAKEFLRSAYQNKVEFLSAVADQAQIASGRD
jgi:hypothetical protein